MVKVTPSPDWFVGFSDFRTISFDTEAYYNRIVIQSYVWDSGTDAGQTYTALDRDLDPQVPVERVRVDSVPRKGQFLSPSQTYIPTPAEFECVLRVGEGPVIPGVPFNESHIRPPLYVPRDDDFIDGVEPHLWKQQKKNKKKSGAASIRSVSRVLGVAAVTAAAAWIF